ncbi:hypothetical protein IFM89_004415 [Coptis chinensis]|uniref:Uncharacterized protein n=1 Tax=Coptis chinensis TaxID=261450 RepID=A0A835M7A6_9MAGN|nr:hypothetical protein IFM89_004415 [Coptis chinensis]
MWCFTAHVDYCSSVNRSSLLRDVSIVKQDNINPCCSLVTLLEEINTWVWPWGVSWKADQDNWHLELSTLGLRMALALVQKNETQILELREQFIQSREEIDRRTEERFDQMLKLMSDGLEQTKGYWGNFWHQRIN